MTYSDAVENMRVGARMARLQWGDGHLYLTGELAPTIMFTHPQLAQDAPWLPEDEAVVADDWVIQP
jgi:hypothetical protein